MATKDKAKKDNAFKLSLYALHALIRDMEREEKRKERRMQELIRKGMLYEKLMEQDNQR